MVIPLVSTGSGGDCPLLDDPDNGHVTVDFGVAVYNCSEGYELSNTEQRVCQENDQWSGMAPMCLGKYVQQEFITQGSCSYLVSNLIVSLID